MRTFGFIFIGKCKNRVLICIMNANGGSWNREKSARWSALSLLIFIVRSDAAFSEQLHVNEYPASPQVFQYQPPAENRESPSVNLQVEERHIIFRKNWAVLLPILKIRDRKIFKVLIKNLKCNKCFPKLY